MLYESGLPTSFWGEALASFIHVHNRVSTTSVTGMTPHEAFLGSKPDLSMLRVWGCTSYVLIQKDKRPLASLGSHMEKCVFIEYPQGYKAWKFYNPVSKKVLISEKADFDERFFLNKKNSTPQLPPARPDCLLDPSHIPVHLPENLEDNLGDTVSSQKPVHGGDVPACSELPSACPEDTSAAPSRPSTPPSPAQFHTAPPLSTPSISSSSSPAPSPAQPPPAPTRPQRNRRPRAEWLPEQWTVPQHYRQPTPMIQSSSDESDSDDPLDVINVHSASVPEPMSYRQSQSRSDKDSWHQACLEEMEAHKQNGTWQIVKLPPGKHAIGSRWFMKVKYNADGLLERYKARLVAKGYSQ